MDEMTKTLFALVIIVVLIISACMLLIYIGRLSKDCPNEAEFYDRGYEAALENENLCKGRIGNTTCKITQEKECYPCKYDVKGTCCTGPITECITPYYNELS